MAYYEATFIVRQDVAPSDVDALREELTKVLEGEGGKVIKHESWGLRTLAYKMKKNKKGHYVLLYIDAPAAAIAELQRKMRLNEDILRQLVIKVDAISKDPSPMAQQQQEAA